ncbi:murinoglobulin-2-like [Penaeus monodon]|uniref:murinoglobulin-2-like n=1 Tax=Penaeus monodon TaxID=6687 RepID=UPI0018A6E49A|nr:murinoglobulin-2-like [Penaeus monodon]
MYKPGQEVKVRVLSLHGAELLLVTEKYPEIWVTTPSRTRVAQWNNVDNSGGLVHLSFQLADEPEQGIYTISVKNSQNKVTEVMFEVEEYVLPRFEVKVNSPVYILARAKAFSIGVCAEYTFGQPVRGNVTIEVSNSLRNQCQTKLVKTKDIAGCTAFQFTTEELRVIDCSVRVVAVEVVVEEEGTGVRQTDGANIWIEMQLYSFKIVYKDKYKKPNLPYTLKARLTFFNGTAAERVPVEVCAAGKCATMFTQEDGIIATVVWANYVESIKISTLDHVLTSDRPPSIGTSSPFYSPSNSSLVIQAPGGRVKCVPGQKTRLNLPVLFSCQQSSRAGIHAQKTQAPRNISPSDRVSRKDPIPGPKRWNWRASELPIDPDHLIDGFPPTYPSPPIVRAKFSLQVVLPPTASPKVKLLIWDTRDDGEVVADSVQLDVERCLGFSAQTPRGQRHGPPGEEIELSLESEAHAVCSLGVVDRSSELAAQGLHYRPSAETLLLASLQPRRGCSWSPPQVDDEKYCARKIFEGSVGEDPSHSFGEHSYSSDYVDSLKMFDNSGLLVISDMTLELDHAKERTGKVSGR